MDERFKAFVWQSLAGLKQITIGVVEKVGGGGPAGPGGVGSQREGSEATSTNGTPTPAPVRSDSPSTSAAAANAEFATPVPTPDQSAQSTPAAEAGHKVGGLPKQKRSRASTASEGAAHLGRHTPFSTFARSNPSTALLSTNEDYRIRVLIKDEVLGEGREGLVRKYGDALRITVEKQSIWRSITGSHETVRFFVHLFLTESVDLIPCLIPFCSGTAAESTDEQRLRDTPIDKQRPRRREDAHRVGTGVQARSEESLPFRQGPGGAEISVSVCSPPCDLLSRQGLTPCEFSYRRTQRQVQSRRQEVCDEPMHPPKVSGDIGTLEDLQTVRSRSSGHEVPEGRRRRSGWERG